MLIQYDDEENDVLKQLGENKGYLDIDCPNCGRMRVEHWSSGKDICEKCRYCIQDNRKYYELDI